MADDDTEIPEAKDPFERQVALTVAILAVILSVISSAMDSARLNAVLASNQANDQWSYYQAKSVKDSNFQIAENTLKVLQDGVVDADKRTAMLASLEQSVQKYDKEKAEIQAKATDFAMEVKYQDERIEKLEKAEMLLHIAIVLGSITILVRLPALWWTCLALGLVGVVLGILPFFLHRESGETTKPEGASYRLQHSSPALAHQSRFIAPS